MPDPPARLESGSGAGARRRIGAPARHEELRVRDILPHAPRAETPPAANRLSTALSAPTRRAILGGGLARGRLEPRPRPRRRPAPRRRTGSWRSRRRRRGSPCSLRRPNPQPPLAYSGAIPGPLLRRKKGEELKLRFENRLAEPTTLCFPGLRTANAAAGYGGLTGPRLKPGASADIRFVPPDSGFNLYLPHAGATDAGQQGRGLFGPIVVEEAEPLDVDDDFIVVLSDWSVDDKGQIKDDFSDPALARGAGRGAA